MAILEKWLVIALLIAGAGAASYFKGRGDEHALADAAQYKLNVQALQAALTTVHALADKDEAARAEADKFIARVQRGLADVNARFASLPNVVVDTSGCRVLADGFRLRWNAAGAAADGPTEQPTTGTIVGPLPSRGQPAP